MPWVSHLLLWAPAGWSVSIWTQYATDPLVPWSLPRSEGALHTPWFVPLPHVLHQAHSYAIWEYRLSPFGCASDFLQSRTLFHPFALSIGFEGHYLSCSCCWIDCQEVAMSSFLDNYNNSLQFCDHFKSERYWVKYNYAYLWSAWHFHGAH